MEKITLCVDGYVLDNNVPENLYTLKIGYDDDCNIIYMRPKHHVLENIIVSKDLDVEVRELGEVGKRIKFSEYWIEIFYNVSLKDKFKL